MATFAPSSSIGLCNVPFDSTYRNQIYFENAQAQSVWFTSKCVYQFTNYLVVRKTMPNGGVRSSIKVEKNIDELYNCNYMMYMNANHGSKWFYAFITQLIYINEETTEIVFETDVYQTWLFDVEIKESFVVREHSVTDYLGEHRVSEQFQYCDYTYTYVDDIFTLSSWGYLVALSNPCEDQYEGENPKSHSGIYQGLYFYFFNTTELARMRTFFAGLDIDSVQFVTVIPRFCVSNATIGPTEENPNVSPFYIQETSSPAHDVYEYNFDISVGLFEDYKPKNNKLYTSPYTNLLISQHTGDAVVLNLEDFNSQGYGYVELYMYGDISASPSVMVYPRNYRGIPHNVDCGFTVRDFAQCSTTNDAYKLWWAKNRESWMANRDAAITQMALGIVNSGIGGAAGVFTQNPIMATAGFFSGANQIAAGAAQLMQSDATAKAAEYIANRATTGNPTSNLLTAIGWKKFSLYKRSLRKDSAKMVDDFFTMYGYQTNKVKIPNVSKRPYFNYVHTNGINLVGSIPNDDMQRLKRVYDEGVTLWKPNATVGDYSVDNSPTYT